MAIFSETSNQLGTRRNVFMAVMGIVVAIFIGRLIQLQIIQGSQYRLQADAQGIKQMTIQPIRGALYDRNGYIVVGSDGSHSLYVTPNTFDSASKKRVAELLSMSPKALDTLIKRYEVNEYSPARILRDIDDTTWAKLNEFYHELAGVELENETKRFYSDDVRASHILGYVKEIDRKEMNKSEYYTLGDVIGKEGIEKEFEDFLRGDKGFEFVAVNNRGQRIEQFNDGKSDQQPSNGFDLFLGLDAELQAYGEYLMKASNYTGAIVAIDPQTGEILAMVSAPDYDLNIFNGVTSMKEYNKLAKDTINRPLTNRATFGVYPPGSTWKILMAIAGLEEGLITPTSTISCGGSFAFGGRSWACHGGHGAVSVQRAIQASCNVFFYKLGLKMGIDTYNEWGSKFHFGKRLGVDVPEGATLLPSRAYYEKHFGKSWPKGIMVNLGIGQGELQVSPLQLAAYTAAIANDGRWIKPHFVSKVRNKKLGTIEDMQREVTDLKLNKEFLKVVQQGMSDVVNVPGGTAGHIKLPDIQIAGKTGTAQNKGKDHSWFISYAPFDNPKIAMCVLVENSGFGGTHAAPVSQKLINFYLNRVAVDGFVKFQDRPKPPPRADLKDEKIAKR